MKIKKNYLKALKYFVLACILVTAVQVQAQDNKTRIKIHKIEDGKTISIDTVLVNPTQEDIDLIVDEHNISTDDNGNITINIEGVHGNERIIMRDGNSGDHNLIWFDKKGNRELLIGDDNSWVFHADQPTAFLGIMMKETMTVENVNGQEERTHSNDGVVVDEVIEDSPAAKAKFVANDVIQSMDGKTISDSKSLLDYLSEKNPGDVIQVQVERDGKIKNLSVTLGERKMMNKRVQHFEIDEDHKPRHFKDRMFKKHHGSKAFLGINLGMKIEFENINGEEIITHTSEQDSKGALITGLVEEGPAEAAGLLENDIIVAMDQVTIKSDEDLLEFLKDKKTE